MKKITLSLLISALCWGAGLYSYSAGSISVAGSYGLRAYGAEANYWNPANLYYQMPYHTEIILINSYLSLQNNALSIGKYNDINGTYLSDEDKHDIINDLGRKLILESEFVHNIGGIAFHNLALSGRINLAGSGNLSSKYVKLLLIGNEYDYAYIFDRDDNNIELLGYVDLTAGLCPFSFYLGEYQVHTGIALSFLWGIGLLTTENYSGVLLASDDGISLKQEIVLKSGFAGYGMKSLIGFRSDLNENLSLGLTIDNLGGFIHWTQETERHRYTAEIDSVYIAKLDMDILEHSESTEKIGSFTTPLPINVRISALYSLGRVNISLDWKQGFTNSVLTDKTPGISMGSEYLVRSYLPIRMGFSPPLGDNPYLFTYGAGYVTDRYELNLGLKSEGYIFPSRYAKGLALAISAKWRF